MLYRPAFMAVANAAERDGARAKAARTYAQAWWLSQDRVDLAAKAMKELIATNNQFDAARIWNTLTPAQKNENSAVLRGITIDTREVATENVSRRPALLEAIKTGLYDRALEIAMPMAQADPRGYAGVAGVLMF